MQCINLNAEANIGPVNVSIVGYCDDLILLSPVESHLQLLLSCCESISCTWRIRFNPKKSTVFYNDRRQEISTFSISGGQLLKVHNFLNLGLPISDKRYDSRISFTKLKSLSLLFV